MNEEHPSSDTPLGADRPQLNGVTTTASSKPDDASVGRAIDVIQTVVTGLILAFIFRAFLVEPFIIPTGSMANALLGAHATRLCPACGWEYDFAPLHSASPVGTGFVRPHEIVCPNCQLHLTPTAEDTLPKAGDRVLVHKWPYLVPGFGPHRWDVIVFRDPADAEQHYIKRVVGLPDEIVEIVDGDLFIDGHIARKPAHVQQALWLVVYDQEHVPAPSSAAGRAPRWFSSEVPTGSAVGWYDTDTRVIKYAGLDEEPRTLAFNPDTGREYLLDMSGYNRGSSGAYVRDLRITSEVWYQAGEGWCRWELIRSPLRFAAEVCADGTVTLVMGPELGPREEDTRWVWSGPALQAQSPTVVEFGHVDYRAYVKIDGEEVLSTPAEGYLPDLEQLRDERVTAPAQLKIVAADMQIALHGLRIDRDVYYTRSNYSQRGYAGRPFVLSDEEYFVLGDNSADSHDSREWTRGGMHLPADYRPGTVRTDQIVGQAAFVYLPGLLPIDRSGRWLVPDLGRVRFIR